MNAPSEDMADILAGTSALALTLGTDLFCNNMPETPDACVSVYDTGGDGPEAADYILERPTFQIRVRGDKGDYRDAHEKAQLCRNTLHKLANYSMTESRYIGIWCSADVMFVGPDDNGRPNFTVNFRLMRTDV